MTRFIGIDPGLTATGLATAEGYAHLVIPAERSIARLFEIQRAVAKFLLDQIIPVCVVAIEGYSFASRNQAHQLGELGGAIRMLLVRDRISYIDVPPPMLKKFVCNKGNSKKDEMRLGVFKRWGKEFSTEHEIDAYALAKLAEAVADPSVKLTKPQQEVVRKLQLQLTASKPNSDAQEQAHGSSKLPSNHPPGPRSRAG